MTPLVLGLILSSAALHAVWSVLIKQSDDPIAFNWLQMALGCVVALAVLAGFPELRAVLRAADWGFWRRVVGAAFCHGLYMLWMGRALAEADLSLVYPISRSTPAFLPLAAGPLLTNLATKQICALSWRSAPDAAGRPAAAGPMAAQ